MSTHSPDEIRAQLTKMLASKVFASAERIRRFLEFTVEHAIRSPDHPLKEIIIGNELYAANGEFDPRLSAVVRVDANRLRTKLREYYDSEGVSDSLQIDLPKGTYTPVFRSSGSEAAQSAISTRDRADPSIAVLPFTNLSPEPGDYFSDGLTEEIIHALSSVRGMHVVARTSCFALKHQNADVREVGKALNVHFVLEGSVRKSGDTLRVTARLVSANDGYQLWSRRYDRGVDNLFAVQDDISREIVSMLSTNSRTTDSASAANSTGLIFPLQPHAAAGEPEATPLSSPSRGTQRPANFDAYAWYLRGRFHLNRQTRESFHRAIECFDEALQRSPQYPAALSATGVAWFYLGLFSMDPPLQVLPKARDASARALMINPRWGEALSISACTKAMFEHQWSAAEQLFRQALDAEPGSELSKHLFALVALLPLARLDEALEVIGEAARIDPLSPFVSATKTAILLMAHRLLEAEAECRRALELDPNFWRAFVGLGRCYEARGRYQDAIECFERATVLSDRVPTSIGALGRAYSLAGRKKEAQELISELDQLARQRYVSPYAKALVYLGLEDERVFDCLEQCYKDRTGWLAYFASDPRFDRLRSDARFRSLLERLRLPIINPSELPGRSLAFETVSN